MSEKDLNIREVDMTFHVRVFGRVRIEEVYAIIENVRADLVAYENKFNSTHILRMHVHDGGPR